MKDTMGYIKNRFVSIKVYCKNAATEIRERNIATLGVLSILTTAMILFFIFLTPVIFPNWRPTLHYILFFVAALLFMLTTIVLQHIRNLPEQEEGLARWFFMLLVSGFLTVIDTVPFPDTAQIFVGIFMTVAPILFIVSIEDMLAFQLIGTGFFLFMGISVKTPEIMKSDIYTTVFGFLVGIIIYFIVMDVRAQEYTRREKYKHSSEMDALTGIANRAYCKQQIEVYLQKRSIYSSCALLIMDVDDFKMINDRLGHENGDRVLHQVADILQSVFDETDIVGRIGGDEFIVFIKDFAKKESILQKCNEMKNSMRNVLEGKFNITMSIGICILNDDTAAIEEIFHVADNAMYEAKAFEKGTYILHEFVRTTTRQEDKPLMVIVDDSMIDREIIAVQFQEEYQLMKFEDSRLALAYIQKNAKDISVVLLNLNMPELNGFEMLKKLKSKADTGWIPVIAVSSAGEMEEKALCAGAEDMILKPIVPAIARIRVNRVLQKYKRG